MTKIQLSNDWSKSKQPLLKKAAQKFFQSGPEGFDPANAHAAKSTKFFAAFFQKSSPYTKRHKEWRLV